MAARKKRRSKKRRKARKNQIPISVLKRRYTKLGNIIKRRGG